MTALASARHCDHDALARPSTWLGAVCDALHSFDQIVVTSSGQVQTDFRHYVTKHRAALLPRLVGWETVKHPTDPELIALATKVFHAHDRMTGERTLA